MENRERLSSIEFGIRGPDNARSPRHTDDDDSAVKQIAQEASLTTKEKKSTRVEERRAKLWAQCEVMMEQLEAEMQQIKVKMQQFEADDAENRAKILLLQRINLDNEENWRRLDYEMRNVQLKMHRWARDLKYVSFEMAKVFRWKVLESIYMGIPCVE